MTPINFMLIGAITLACAIISLFFLRSWKSTQDRFFLFFAGSFMLQSISTLMKGLIDYSSDNEDNNPLIYLIRLLAFIIILIAIVDKNRARKHL
jgi:hypothetical protein